MRYLISIALISALLTSCGGKKEKGVDTKTGLTPEHYDMVKEINDSFSDLDSAVQLAVEGKTTNPSDKVTKLAELIKNGGCREDGKPFPSEDYNKNWNAGYTVGAGSACPVTVRKDWKFMHDSLSKSWSYVHRIDTQTGNFRDESLVESFALHKADLIVNNRNGQQQVDGNFQYSNFFVKGAGLLTASLRTTQTYTAARAGGGTLTFNLNSRKEFKVKVVITWRTGRPNVYRINGYNVERNVIDDLFSSFGLMQVKERSENMLY